MLTQPREAELIDFNLLFSISHQFLLYCSIALLFAALIKKPFLTQLIFGGGPINARSGSVQVAV